MNLKESPYYRSVLKNALSERIEKNPKYSLRAFASSLDIEPSALSQILSGKRLLTEKMAKRFFKALDLSPEEQAQFVYSIAETKSALGVGRMSPGLKSILKTPPVFERKPLNGEIFRTISDWYHTAILEMTKIEGFQPEARFIAQQLKISQAQAQLALERLKELELLEEKDGVLVKADQWIDTLDKGTTSSAHKRRQKQVLEKSIASLENDPIEKRNHSAMTIPIDLAKIPLAKKRIQKFMWRLANELSCEKKEQVYELVVNLFPLQNPSVDTQEK